MTLFSKKERKNRETLTFHEKDIHEFFCSKCDDDDDDDVFSFIGDKIVLGKKL